METMSTQPPKSRKPRIAHVAYTFLEDDARVKRYCDVLSEMGNEVHVFCLRRKGQANQENLDGVRVFRLQKREVNEKKPLIYLARILRFFFLVGFRLSISNLARPYDLIHVHNVPDFLVFSCLLCRVTGSRIILDIHDLLPELYMGKFGGAPSSFVARGVMLAERLSARIANHVIVANDIWRERLIKRSLPAWKCTSLMNYPDTKTFHPQTCQERGPRNHGFRILYPGTLNSHQGLMVALKAFGLLRDRIPGVRLEIYGEGPDLPKLKSMAKEAGLEDTVYFHAPVPLSEIALIMANSDLGVIPKLAEGFGDEAFSTKSMEFMACGVPVVMSRTKVDSYYFTDEQVRFFDSGDPQALAEAIWEVYSKPEETRRRVEAALALVSKENWENKKHLYLDLVEKLLSERR